MKFTKQDWVIGAVYRMRPRITKDLAIDYLISRAGLTPHKAKQLYEVWR